MVQWRLDKIKQLKLCLIVFFKSEVDTNDNKTVDLFYFDKWQAIELEKPVNMMKNVLKT